MLHTTHVRARKAGVAVITTVAVAGALTCAPLALAIQEEPVAVKGVEYEATSSTAVTVEKATSSELKKTTKVSIPATITYDGKTYKVTSIVAGAYQGAKKLTTVTIGKNVKTIGASAFANCTKLKKVTLGAAVTKIGAKSFKGDKKLKTVTIKSKKLKKSGVKNAFKGSSVKTVKVPKAKVKAYKKIFTKKNCGKKVTVKKA